MSCVAAEPLQPKPVRGSASVMITGGVSMRARPACMRAEFVRVNALIPVRVMAWPSRPDHGKASAHAFQADLWASVRELPHAMLRAAATERASCWRGVLGLTGMLRAAGVGAGFVVRPNYAALLAGALLPFGEHYRCHAILQVTAVYPDLGRRLALIIEAGLRGGNAGAPRGHRGGYGVGRVAAGERLARGGQPAAVDSPVATSYRAGVSELGLIEVAAVLGGPPEGAVTTLSACLCRPPCVIFSDSAGRSKDPSAVLGFLLRPAAARMPPPARGRRRARGTPRGTTHDAGHSGHGCPTWPLPRPAPAARMPRALPPAAGASQPAAGGKRQDAPARRDTCVLGGR